jgi:phosphate transport system substrate-binding protein
LKVKRMWPRTASLAVASMLLLAACGSGNGNESQPAGSDGNGGSGGIFVSGSSTVEPISLANAEKFVGENPNVQISVEGPGTSDGFAIFCDGGSDISDASRAIKQEEVDICAENGVEFAELEVGIDGLSVITSNADPVECLSFLDLYALLGPESEGFASWSDANELADELAGELGDEYGASHAPYPDAPLDVTAPGEESGTFDSFVEIVIAGIAEARGQDETTRPDYQASPDDNVIVEGISGSDSSLGWVGYAFAVNNADAIHPIPIDGGDGCVEPTEETISDGSYPIARSLYIYPSLTALEDSAALEAFVDFYMSDEGFASVTEVGYVSLPEDRIEATRTAWEERRAGKFTD